MSAFFGLLVFLSWVVAAVLSVVGLYVVGVALWGSIGDWKRYLRRKRSA